MESVSKISVSWMSLFRSAEAFVHSSRITTLNMESSEMEKCYACHLSTEVRNVREWIGLAFGFSPVLTTESIIRFELIKSVWTQHVALVLYVEFKHKCISYWHLM